jgi:predicted nucleotidyltransferase
MTSVTITDLTDATAQAVALSKAVGEPTTICGALAMAAHGYRRETSDVDIVLPVVIGTPSGDAVEAAAALQGLTVRAKHGFGGLDLRSGGVRIDVLTLDKDVPGLIPDAVAEAVASDRRAKVFGYEVYVVSVSHLITMKLIAERKKDIADIVELIKVRVESGEWDEDYRQARRVVEQFLGRYAVRVLDRLVESARQELR